MPDRYFVDITIQGTSAVLAGSEAHHLAHVMRAKPGELVTLFDGSGAQFDARVEVVGRSQIELTILARRAVDRELPMTLVLGVALPKGERQRWLIEKAVELGASRLVPLVTERSGAQASAAVERLRRAVVEASKQCGRNRLMEIAPPQPIDEFLAAATGDWRLIAVPGGASLESRAAALAAGPRPAAVWLAIGPEGGFTAQEVAAATALGWQEVGCGPRILRVETAALALLAAIALRLQAD